MKKKGTKNNLINTETLGTVYTQVKTNKEKIKENHKEKCYL